MKIRQSFVDCRISHKGNTVKITILCVGKIKERFYREAVEEYAKRLSRYCKLEICEAADERTPDSPSPAQKEQILHREAQRLEKHLCEDAYVIALAVDGRKMSSEQLALHLEKQGVGGTSHIQFLIGGSLGLEQRLLERADLKLSFSDMTFPHQLMRVILLEQIYRSFRIIHQEPYHK